MTVKQQPTFHRLIAKFKALGPYLRESESTEECFVFDCLSVCVDEKKSPECREFWGWWMKLEKQDELLVARFHHGKYDTTGAWIDESLPQEAEKEVMRTQTVFQEKVESSLAEHFGLSFKLHEDSEAIV